MNKKLHGLSNEGGGIATLCGRLAFREDGFDLHTVPWVEMTCHNCERVADARGLVVDPEPDARIVAPVFLPGEPFGPWKRTPAAWLLDNGDRLLLVVLIISAFCIGRFA